MSPVNRLAPRAILMASLVTLTLATALADHATDDAGKGVDAGNTKETAMALDSYGSYHGYLERRDMDWYRLSAATASPRCIEVRASGENNDTIGMSIQSTDRLRTMGGMFPAGGSKTLALAVPNVKDVWFNITASPNSANSGDPARPGHYDFTIARMGVPTTSMGDALTGGDVGGSIEKSAPVPGPCFGGSIAPLSSMGDMRDTFSFQAKADQAVTYGFAVAGDPGLLVLQVLDPAGNAIGPALTSGQYASIMLPTSGTYYLSASSTSLSTEDVGYLISVIIGPPDPGHPCRPYC